MRNALAISGLALAIGASGFTLDASANTGNRGRIQRSHQERIVRTKKITTERIATGRRVTVGTVSEKTGSTITLTRGAKTYTVNASTDTRVLNKTWNTIALSDIKVGDKIRVFGTVSDTTISAKTIRDISLS